MNRGELKALRAKNNLNQTEMANILGISLTSYLLKETGKREFTDSEISKLIDYFKVPATIFFGNECSKIVQNN